MSLLLEQFGEIDIYLFDQLLRGRIEPGMRILDAGCGFGRNVIYLLRQGYEVFAVDRDSASLAEAHKPPDAAPNKRGTAADLAASGESVVRSSSEAHRPLDAAPNKRETRRTWPRRASLLCASSSEVRHLAASLAPQLSPDHFRTESVETMSFPDAFADFAICSAVLHFAQNDQQFESMLAGIWRVLRPGGVFFCRLASLIGIQHQVRRIAGRRFLLPDGSERYLVDEALLDRFAHDLGGQKIDPLKTTVVQNERSMTTWVLRKNG